jgi:2-(1,2-epoxy-1,2-dihydrophenyl)acetyl-CoA isomerase
MKFETLELVKQDKIATITFNRPELLNAVNEQFIWDFQKATSDVKEDNSIKVLIINASGRGFCAGADLSERKSTWEGSQDALMRGFKPFFENILSMPKPVIAAVQGPAAGIGASIALVPDGGLSWFLPRFMGYSKAYEYAIEAKKIRADECLHFGMVNKVVPEEELMQYTIDWASKLAKRSSQSLAHTKKLMRDSLHNDYWKTFSDEAEIQNDLTRSPQNYEAVSAFFEKREPNFD